MGHKIKVYAWMLYPDQSYKYAMVYAGESWIKALWAMLRAKRAAGYVKVEWR